MLVIAFLYLLQLGSEGKNSDDKGLIVTALLKGTYYQETGPCKGNVHYLVEINVMNISNEIKEFMTYDCTTAGNVVSDSKGIVNWVNLCPSNSMTEIKLKPKQIFSVPVILLSEKEINTKVKFGFICLNRKIVASPEDFYLIINKSREKLENVIWSEPIMIDIRYGNHYTIK